MTLCYSFEQSEKLVKVVKMKKVVKCEIITQSDVFGSRVSGEIVS